MKLIFALSQYHNSHSEISIKELSVELDAIEQKLERIKMVQESILLSFIFDYKWLTKKEKELKEDWLVLESFLMELKRNKNKVEYSEFDYDLEA